MEATAEILHQIEAMEAGLRRLRDLVTTPGCLTARGITRQTAETDEVLHVVAGYYGLSRDDVLGKRRPNDVAWARQVICWIIRRLHPDISLEGIGRVIDRDQSTVAWSIRRVMDRIETEPKIACQVQRILTALDGDAKA